MNGPAFALALLATAALSATPPMDATPPMERILNGTRCADAANLTLNQWNVDARRVLPDPPGPTGTRIARVPTDTIGVWVRLTVDPVGDVLLERVSATSLEMRRFGPSCEVIEMARASQPRLFVPDTFTDARLSSVLARGNAGVILIWSPHMPLSVDQFHELVAATETLGVEVVALLDPAADPHYGRRVAYERMLPSSALQRLTATELLFRGMTTHAPSVQVFADGQLTGPVLFGYRSRATARAAIEEILGYSHRAR